MKYIIGLIIYTLLLMAAANYSYVLAAVMVVITIAYAINDS